MAPPLMLFDEHTSALDPETAGRALSMDQGQVLERLPEVFFLRQPHAQTRKFSSDIRTPFGP